MSDSDYIARRLPADKIEATVPPLPGRMEALIAHYAEPLLGEFKEWIASLGKTMDEIVGCEGASEPPTSPSFTISARFMVTFTDGSKHGKIFSQDTLKDYR